MKSMKTSLFGGSNENLFQLMYNIIIVAGVRTDEHPALLLFQLLLPLAYPSALLYSPEFYLFIYLFMPTVLGFVVEDFNENLLPLRQASRCSSWSIRFIDSIDLTLTFSFPVGGESSNPVSDAVSVVSNDSCCPSLSWKSRIIGFIVMSVVGILLSIVVCASLR